MAALGAALALALRLGLLPAPAPAPFPGWWMGREEEVLLLRAGPFRSCFAASARSGRLSFFC